MYANVGVERDATRLRHALRTFRRLASRTQNEELRDAATVAALIAESALRRRETRGSHVRLDHPGRAPDECRSFVTPADLERTGRSA
jgi:L-aspartate oxidase